MDLRDHSSGALRRPAEPAAPGARAMTCPECGEDARRQRPASLVNWRAHGIAAPRWSHLDGSPLCPVIGPSGGYEPARPVPGDAR